ncbi:MAG TPA: hypothetical protein VF808_15015 [Ktedonobacterales bacterium]
MAFDGIPEEPPVNPPSETPNAVPPSDYTPPPGVAAPPPDAAASQGSTPQPNESHPVREFLTGLVIGIVPLILAMVGVGVQGLTALACVAGILYFTAFLVALAERNSAPARKYAAGMFTALLASLVIFGISCQPLHNHAIGP